MRAINNIFIVIVTIMMLGCAATPRGRAVQFVMASDAMADEIADDWKPYVQASVDECRAKLPGTPKDTPEGRAECIGFAGEGEKLEAGLQALVAVQKSIELAVHCDSNPLQVPAEFMDKCVAGKKADWNDLLTQIMSAWNYIRPFYTAMKSRKAK
jgi:hypothetical protein